LPPIAFTDLSLLFAVAAITLLITAELASTYYGQTNLTISTKKLKNAGYIVVGLFLITAFIRIISLI
jgi:hypothetical protein